MWGPRLLLSILYCLLLFPFLFCSCHVVTDQLPDHGTIALNKLVLDLDFNFIDSPGVRRTAFPGFKSYRLPSSSCNWPSVTNKISGPVEAIICSSPSAISYSCSSNSSAGL